MSNKESKQGNLKMIQSVFVYYIHGIIDKIAMITKRNHIKTMFYPPNIVWKLLINDLIAPTQYKEVYKITCSCRKSYIDEMDTRFRPS